MRNKIMALKECKECGKKVSSKGEFNILRYIALLLLTIFSTSAFAEWTSINKIDEFTDKQVISTVYYDEFHQIHIQYQGVAEYKSVWMYINRKKIGTIKAKTTIELRVDKYKTVKISFAYLRELISELPTYYWKPDLIGFEIWHGNEKEGCGFIGQLISGQELKMRYRLSSRGENTFSISLSGAREALVDGLGLKICGQNQ